MDYALPLSLNEIHVQLFTIHWTTITASFWNFHNNQDSFWRLYVNDRPGAAVEYRGTWLPLQAEKIYIIPAGVRFNTRCEADVGHFYIHFDLAGLPPLALREIFAQPLEILSAPFLVQSATELITALQGGQVQKVWLHCQAKSLIFAALAAYFQGLPPSVVERAWQTSADLKAILPALRYIEVNLADPLPNALLAEQCCMSEDFFIRRFRAGMQQTPARYIREQRIKRAAQALRFSEHSMEQIATANGFHNRYHFSRVFSQVMKIAPGAYRKREYS